MANITYTERKQLQDQNWELIQAHLHDPDNSPLPEKQQAQLTRIISAAKMVESYHPTKVISLLKTQYNISYSTALNDVHLAQELFKSKQKFDWDFWQQWQIKDLVETIRICQLQNRQKERIAAHKVLREVIGEKLPTTEDPKQMEKNTFYIQINNNSQTINLPISKIKGLNANEIQTVIEAITTPVQDDAEIAEILEIEDE